PLTSSASFSPYDCRQWVVDAESWETGALTLEAGDRSPVRGHRRIQSWSCDPSPVTSDLTYCFSVRALSLRPGTRRRATRKCMSEPATHRCAVPRTQPEERSGSARKTPA